MNKININIKDSYSTFKYLIEYNRVLYNNDSEISYSVSGNRVDIYNENSHWVKYNNDWIKNQEWANNTITDYLPKSYRLANVKIYWPEFSVDTYFKTDYILTANTWINGVYVYLGSYIFNRLDAIASESIVSFEGNKYYEYSEIDIIDPRDIAYSDSWKEWRNKVCGEPLIDDENYNNTGSQINFTLYPVQEVDGKYMILDGYSGGQNGMNMADQKNDYLNIHSELEIGESVEIKYDIKFNNEYGSNLNEYLKETYNLENIKCVVRLITNSVESVDDIIMIEKDLDDICKFTKNDIRQLSIMKGWPVDNDEFTTGLFLNTSLSISKQLPILNLYVDEKIGIIKLIDLNGEVLYKYPIPSQLIGKSYKKEIVKSSKENPIICNNICHFTEDQQFVKLTYLNDIYYIKIEPQELLYIISNSIPLTQEIFKYLIVDDNKIDLSKINMNHYNINAINKIENRIVKVDGVNDAKSNIIQSVFFRVKDSQDLLIHPQVTENICINLDQYKSKVDAFILKIDDCCFNQIGSTPAGIIFKVIGGKIGAQKTSGIYYILNQDSELVTSGKYISVF